MDIQIVKRVLKVKDVSKILDIGIRQTYQAARSGEIPFIKIGGQYRISQDRLDKFLNGEK